MTDKLRATAQALVNRWDSPQWGGSAENLRHTGEYIAELRAALEEQPAEQVPFKPDWDRVEALRESLREHMADVRQLRAALAWIASHKNSDWPERCQQIVDRARAALAEQPAEPVAAVHLGWDTLDNGTLVATYFLPVKEHVAPKLYTAPQPAKRVPLTDEEIAVIYLDTAEESSGGGLRRMEAFARAVIAAYEAKNSIGVSE